jgi:hypothetical protein
VHIGCGLLDTILKGDNPRTIPAKFGLIWFIGFWVDINVIFYKKKYAQLVQIIGTKWPKEIFHRITRNICWTTLCHVAVVKTKTIREILILSYGCHLDKRAALLDTILQGKPKDHPHWFDLVSDVWWMPSDSKSSHGLWTRWAKNEIMF